jgi:ubiquinone/menaquinone biosynthesis C-methylase UbiE
VRQKQKTSRVFSPAKAKEFYDRFGPKQDWQIFYEHAAIKDLVAHADLEHSSAVFEFGFGTGKLAEQLLSSYLPQMCTYYGIDISTTMVELAHKRLSHWGHRVELRVFDGTKNLNVQEKLFDHFLSTYVFDLLAPDDILHVLSEAHQILKPDGLLCNVSLTRGENFLSRIITWIWDRLYHLNPKFVGGCCPIRLIDYISLEEWQIIYRNTVTTMGITSEVLVAKALFSEKH